jgi:branched-chain amino acid transport system ATP-binding protein
VDEPTAGLSPKLSEQVYDQLLAAQAQGVSIFLVDQNIAKAVEISGYLYMLEMGQVRREGPRHDFADHLRDIIRDALLGA